jgi:hypothetical protein
VRTGAVISSPTSTGRTVIALSGPRSGFRGVLGDMRVPAQKQSAVAHVDRAAAQGCAGGPEVAVDPDRFRDVRVYCRVRFVIAGKGADRSAWRCSCSSRRRNDAGTGRPGMLRMLSTNATAGLELFV